MNKMEKRDISNYIAFCIADELKNIYPETKYVIKDTYNKAKPCIKVQWWYDIEFNRIFIFYELDKFTKINNTDNKEIYLIINTRLMNTFYDYNKMYAELIDPAVRAFDGERLWNSTDSSCKYLRVAAFACWECDGCYKFLESNFRYNYEKNKFLASNGNPSEIIKFEKDVLDLNLKYNFIKNNSEENMKAGFEEYKTLYKNLFGRELLFINKSEVNKFYIDIEYL